MSKQNLSVLVVDDREINNKNLRGMLENLGYEDIRLARNAKDALGMHIQNPSNILVADWMMPGMDGLELTAAVRKHDEHRKRYTAVLLLTAKDGTEPMLEAFESGVDDYLRKPVDSRELAARLYSATRLANQHNLLLTAREVLRMDNERLQQLAVTDPLTGLGNRRYMTAHLESLIKETRARGGVASCALVDLDNFKMINDRYGHPVGDEVLMGFAEILRWSVRPTDIVARIGGEEFAILMHQPDSGSFSPMIFERIRRTIQQHPIKTSTGEIPITASIGVSRFIQEDDFSAEEIVKLADERLYMAKQRGRNRIMC